jgi:hypothetical protein
MGDDRSPVADPDAPGSPGHGGINGSPRDMSAHGDASTQLNNIVKPLFRVATVGILVSASLAGLFLVGAPVAAIFIAGRNVSMGSLIACVASGAALLIATLIAWAGTTTRALKILGNPARQQLPKK